MPPLEICFRQTKALKSYLDSWWKYKTGGNVKDWERCLQTEDYIILSVFASYYNSQKTQCSMVWISVEGKLCSVALSRTDVLLMASVLLKSGCWEGLKFFTTLVLGKGMSK